MVFRLQRYAFFLFYKSKGSVEESSKINYWVSSHKVQKSACNNYFTKKTSQPINLKKRKY